MRPKGGKIGRRESDNDSPIAATLDLQLHLDHVELAFREGWEAVIAPNHVERSKWIDLSIHIDLTSGGQHHVKVLWGNMLHLVGVWQSSVTRGVHDDRVRWARQHHRMAAQLSGISDSTPLDHQFGMIIAGRFEAVSGVSEFDHFDDRARCQEGSESCSRGGTYAKTKVLIHS